MVAASSADFAQPGPCSPSSWQTALDVPEELQQKLPKSLALNVTIPQCPAPGAGGALAATPLPFGPAPFPVLVFFGGFMNRAAWYHCIVEQVASWGVAVVQYDTPLLRLVTIAAELQLFPHLTQWIADQADDPTSPLYGQVDVGRLATAGHSRGGKLASLAFTANLDTVSAAYLVDPVDETRYASESSDNPSAARALEASGRAVGMTAAGLVGSCNPAWAGMDQRDIMFGAAGNGSWMSLLPGVSHSQFLDGGCVANAAADLLCGRGSISRRQVAALTATPLLAWLWDQLEGQGQVAPPRESPLPAFFSWVEQQEVAGRMAFKVKGLEQDEWLTEAAAAQMPAVQWQEVGGEDAEEDCETAAPAAELATALQ